MPNWCQNDVTITGPAVAGIKQAISEERGIFDSVRPRPADQEDNWYAWNVENWGTKWDVQDPIVNEETDNSILLSFDTAWGPPIALYQYLLDNGNSVDAKYLESGMCFIGEWIDGEDLYYDYGEDGLDIIPDHLEEFYNIREMIEGLDDES